MSRVVHDVSELNGHLISYAMSAPAVPMTDFLRRCYGERRVYWESGRDETAFAGFGALLDLVATGPTRFEQMRALIARLWEDAYLTGEDEASDIAPLLLGGFAFQDGFEAQAVWRDMFAAQFVLPRALYIRRGDAHWLVVSDYVADDPHGHRDTLQREAERRFDNLFWNYDENVWNPEWEEASGIEYPMSSDAWGDMVNSAIDQIQHGPLEKVVLSRMCQIRFSRPVNVVRALDYLADTYKGCHRFLFETQPFQSFYGATPETLVSIQNGQLSADALAGTVRRGKTTEQDIACGEELLADPKERSEHEFVVQGIRRAIAAHVDDLTYSDVPGLLKLSNVQHLHTPISARVRDESWDILRAVRQLHPTPALGGTPSAQATEFIAEAEPITRGWYAAPIGWIDREMNGHFGVGIRSAISHNETVWCYAGAGIVAQSDAAKEWRETDLKFRAMLNAVGMVSIEDLQ